MLVLVKVGWIASTISGSHGYVTAAELLPPSFLFLGWDIVGAAGLATSAVLLCLPLWVLGSPRKLHRASLWICGGLQALHAVGTGLSFISARTVGGFITKAGIDLVLLGEAESQVGIWSSVAHFVTLTNVSLLIGLGAIGVGSLVLGRWMAALLWGPRARWTGVVLVALVSGTTLVLPNLVTGSLAGTRVHTYGLELSPGVEFGRSYLGPLFEQPPAERIPDPWTLDLTAPHLAGPPYAERRLLSHVVPRRTHVVLVALESVAMPYLAESPQPMPFLAQLGAAPGGAAFSQHYSTWPQTSKALFSVLCSELPHAHYLPISAANPAIPCASLSEVLHLEGYRTIFVTSADLAYERMVRFIEHRQFDVVRDLRNLDGAEDAWKNSWGVDEKVAIQNIFAEIDATKSESFFVFYGMSAGHHPYFGTREHEERSLGSDRANYMRVLAYIDDRLRELHEGLDARGLLDETLFVVLSDHGEGFGQHIASQSHGPTVYQENIHVPWVLSGPQLRGATTSGHEPTSHIDVAPTLLGLLGLPVPCTMRGRDLTEPEEPRVAIFAGRPPARQTGLVEGDLKYIRESNGLEMVFDLANDPQERVDIVESVAHKLPAWRARLDMWENHSENLIHHYAEIGEKAGCLPWQAKR